MSFEVAYRGDRLTSKYWYSTSKNVDDPFIQKMDLLSKEIRELQEQIEDRKNQMVELADVKIKEDDSHTDDLDSFLPGGELEVDDEEVNISDEWWDNTYEAESPADNKIEELLEHDWFIISTQQRNGIFSLKVAEGWDFHIENLEWKDDHLVYDGERIDNDYEGSEWTDGSAEIRFPILNSIQDTASLEE